MSLADKIGLAMYKHTCPWDVKLTPAQWKAKVKYLKRYFKRGVK